ncbi:MAG: adenylate/guanylate cyclase domain-containing protein [Deltaproteobacteria bacterium]|nr:adenylate/guanylate cyclase domain-containing protein [Deltaproteobacteria bacterium]
MKKSKVPSYYILRIIIFPTILYFLLTLPVFINLFTSNLLELVENGTIPIEVINQIMEMQKNDFNNNDKMIIEDKQTGHEEDAMGFSIIIQLIIFIIFVVFNYPFRIYLRKKRKGKKISSRLSNYTRKLILFTPLINTSIYLSGFLIIQINRIQYFNSGTDAYPVLANMFRHLFIISLVASLLTALFIFSWQKYRVQMKYMEHFFEDNKLRKRIGLIKFSTMRLRLYTSSLVTTSLPLIIISLYIFLNITSIDFKIIQKSNMEILLGEFLEIIRIFGLQEGFYQWLATPEASEFTSLYYIDVSGFIRLFLGIFNGITVSMIYIVFFVKWTNASISKPINEIVKRMKKTSKGDFDSYTTVRTKDEIGKLGEGFNKMVDGLREREKIKSLFGQYLTREISDEILNGHVDLGGELYDATILFADIRNFTSISEKMNPREVVDFLNTYLSEMIDVIISNNGIIDKFMGDGILAVFGVPVSSEDHADRCVNAALTMNKKLKELNRERTKTGDFPISIGIGVHSGPVIGGNLGNSNKLEYTVIGDTVNVASRIETLTKTYNSPFIISDSTYNKLSNELKKKVNMKAITDAEIRGKEKKLTLYSIIS